MNTHMNRQVKLPIRQPRKYSLSEYDAAGCKQFDDSNLLIVAALHRFTSGLMCNGCPIRLYNCAAYNKLLALDKKTKPQPMQTETVREEAKRRNISISEVRRQRRDRS